MRREESGQYFSDDRLWLLEIKQDSIRCDRSHRDASKEHGMCYGHEEHVYGFWQLSKLIDGTYQEMKEGPVKREKIASLKLTSEPA